jgi:hypothetical protein
MIQQMTPRERNLALIVGVLVVGLVTVMLTKTFLRNYRQLKTQRMEKSFQLESMKTLITERDLWVAREQELKSKQPKLENAGSAGVNFLEELQNVAKAHSVMIEQPQINTVVNKPHYQSVSVVFETKSSGPELVDFLRDAQGPTKFTVFTTSTIEVAKNDPTQMQGRFTAERWFAPK